MSSWTVDDELEGSQSTWSQSSAAALTEEDGTEDGERGEGVVAIVGEAERARERDALIVGLARELATAYGVSPAELAAQWPALQRTLKTSSPGVLRIKEQRSKEQQKSPAEASSSSSSSETDSLFFSSRYDREFEDLGGLGQGSFGSVRKVRHRVDRAVYAVKRVIVNGQTLEKYQRELRNLAALQHPNVVRYFGGWLETKQQPTWWRKDSSNNKQGTTLERCEGSLLGGGGGGEKHDRGVLLLGESQQTDSTYDEEDEEDALALPYRRIPPTEKQQLELFLQMELCGERTLRDFIEARNSCCVDDPQKRGLAALRCVSEVAAALAHIHSHDIIHRDIKPENLLLREDLVRGSISEDEDDLEVPPVVIADFGLSTSHDPTHRAEGLSLGDATRQHTPGVGTPSYAAPEQISTLSRASYDASVDVFSLGLIFFELRAPLTTAMERAKAFEALRSGKEDCKSMLLRHRNGGGGVSPLDDSIDELLAQACSRSCAHRPSAAEFSRKAADLVRRHELSQRTNLMDWPKEDLVDEIIKLKAAASMKAENAAASSSSSSIR